MTHSQLKPSFPAKAEDIPQSNPTANTSTNFNFADIRVLQPKLTIGTPNDPYEQEADRVASEVVQKLHSPQAAFDDRDGTLQRSDHIPNNTFSVLPIQRDGGIISGEANSEFESQLNQSRRGGSSLEPQLQGKLESAMGADFNRVKIHTDNQADQLSRSIQAKAFTTGNDVFFKQGAYDPNSKGGQELIAHELTHVIQQNGSAVQRQGDGVIQREITDSQGKSISTAEAIQFLTSNGIDATCAENLVSEHMKGPAMTLGTLLSIARTSSPDTGIQDHTQNNTMGDATEAQDVDDLEEKRPQIESGNLLEVAEFLVGSPPIELYRKIKQIWIDETAQEDKDGAEEQQTALDSATGDDLAREVGTICDFTAYGLMIGAVGVKQLEALKQLYEAQLYSNINSPESDTEVGTDAKSKAFLFKPGDGDKLQQTWQQWKTQDGNSAMQVKFEHVTSGPHTFVIERMGGKVVLYQSYLKHYTLEQYLNHAQEQIGAVPGGELVNPSVIEQYQIHTLVHGLGTAAEIAQLEQDSSQVGLLEPAQYKDAFGVACSSSKHYGEAINAVALLIFENCPMPGVSAFEEVSTSTSKALGLVTNYINILNSKDGSSESASVDEFAKRTELARVLTRDSSKNVFASLLKGGFSLKSVHAPDDHTE